MRKFQLRVTLWIAGTTLAVMLILLLAFTAYMFHNAARASRKKMSAIARKIAVELAETQTSPAAMAELAAKLDDGIGFVERGEKVSFAVVGAQGDIIFEHSGMELAKHPEFLHKQPGRLHLVKVETVAGGDLSDFMSNWHWLYARDCGAVRVLVRDQRRFELAERLRDGALAVLAFALVFALPSGFVLSRKILGPLDAIAQTAAAVRQGNLQARIQPDGAQDEVEALVRELNSTFADLERLFSQIQRFNADAAHELNTPLTALRGNIEVCLAKNRSADEYRQVLAECVQETMTLSRMVKDLLLLANPDQKRIRQDFAPVNLADVLAAACERLEQHAAEKAVTLQSLAPEPTPAVSGNRLLLERACCNLLSNAIRFSPPGGTVSLRLSSATGKVLLAVQDSGLGIAPEHQEHIFERFYQVAPSRSQGNGLGLALVKWITELHGGTVSVASALGQGATFTIMLPGNTP